MDFVGDLAPAVPPCLQGAEHLSVYQAEPRLWEEPESGAAAEFFASVQPS